LFDKREPPAPKNGRVVFRGMGDPLPFTMTAMLSDLDAWEVGEVMRESRDICTVWLMMRGLGPDCGGVYTSARFAGPGFLRMPRGMRSGDGGVYGRGLLMGFLVVGLEPDADAVVPVRLPSPRPYDDGGGRDGV
jgi:hypothetical protein